MQFSIQDWRRFYDRVHQLSRTLRDGMPDKYGNPAVSPLNMETRTNLEAEIKSLTDRSNHYLDVCGLRRPEPLWHYNREDETTWASSDKFAYAHLMRW